MYKRIMLKLSGEVLGGENGHGIDLMALKKIAHEIASLNQKKVEVALVIGGGNLWRYRDTKDCGIERTTSDYMGMLATVMNSASLQSTLESMGVHCRVCTALDLPQIAEPYLRRRAIRHLEKERVVICAGGTGNPYFTTDTAAVLRALELNCEVLLKATKVDGVYTADPQKDPRAKKYKKLSYDEAMRKNLQIMDQTAFSLARDSKLKVIVFNMHGKDAILKAVKKQEIGTLIS